MLVLSKSKLRWLSECVRLLLSITIRVDVLYHSGPQLLSPDSKLLDISNKSPTARLTFRAI